MQLGDEGEGTRQRESSPTVDGEGDTQGEPQRLAELLGQATRGHDEAFAELYDLTSSRIYGLILRVVRSPELAAEVTQETYLEVWKQSSRFEETKGSVLAWMCVIARRRAVDRVRSVVSSNARDERWHNATTVRDVDVVAEGVEIRLESQRVRQGLESLSKVQREAVALTYFGGYSQREVSTLLQLPLGTVKTRIRDGLIGLRDALGVES